ncbi:hypothetical protein [Sorangium sp. So ce1182]|uniref:hypothetical protein n=1 Tax=Sorangium sp. So ce1182 TaxID=3133334 RepID=UPI003F62E15B
MAVVVYHADADGTSAAMAPAQAPEVEAFVSTLGDDPETSTSALTYELLAPIAPVAPRAWLAALGLLGGLGDAARRHPLVAAAARQHGITALREATSPSTCGRR